ncbi:MAG TPA: tetrathionate reductase family octaheme c-type cytochrome [Burkholderiales bacterium]|nr:tetrathionate reductase family octaheme c-type cytochrome [Burkholderiales bacterium]
MIRLAKMGAFLILTLLAAGPARAVIEEHAAIKGPFASGPEVTKTCLKCHKQEAQDFMKTVHWSWSRTQEVPGKGTVDLGKKNGVNNFCIALPSNEPRCTSCHAGFGWKDGSFDFSKAENVDCLICHDTTGTYQKFPTGAGHPAYEEKEFPPGSGKKWKPVDLVKVAQNVGPTSRKTCGACHFFGGGGDHVKHGDLDSSMGAPKRGMDVHMAVDGPNMTCTSCHKTEKHQIPGQALSVSASKGGLTLDCSDCHAGRPHKSKVINQHAKKVACQTCHIPSFSRTLPTLVWWDWSTAGKDQPAPKDEYGEKTYDKQKGSFKWVKDAKPVYMWFNGTTERYLMGEKMDPARVTHLNFPLGSKDDSRSKVTPFKVMQGKTPYDSVNNVFAVPQLFGGYWKHWDWNKAIADGMTAAGLNYGGQFGWAESDMYWKVNHMVVPKNQALGCSDCHGAGKRMDWKALGYGADPMKSKIK